MTIDPNRIAILPFRVATADTLLGEGMAELLATEFTGEGGPRAVDSDTNRAALRCVVGLWRLHFGAAPEADLDLLRRTGNRGCADAVRLLDAVRTGASDLESILAETDSLFRTRILSLVGIENLVLARAWESRGDYRRAASAARLIVEGQGTPSLARATGARMEGRLSLMAGDTTGAIAAYQKYLDLRRDAEPVLIPQRDSVRPDLAKLVRPRS